MKGDDVVAIVRTRVTGAVIAVVQILLEPGRISITRTPVEHTTADSNQAQLYVPACFALFATRQYDAPAKGLE